MIFFRSKMVSAWLMVLVGFSILSAAELGAPDISLPADAVKVMEKTFDVGPSRSLMVTYETALSVERLNALYKKEMVKNGWVERAKNFYLKDNYMAVIVAIPPRESNSKTTLSITTSRIPSKEEVFAARKTTPDKLNFMPIYPESVQAFLWDLPTGVSGSYETESSIKEVVFFYKSGMLNYGWRLYSETPITTSDANCPGCKQSILNTSNTSSTMSMVFRRGDGESCIIRIYDILADRSNLAAINQSTLGAGINVPGKTIILVTYNANKKINP